MASTAERLAKIVGDNIEVDGKALDIPQDLNISLPDAGVSSTDIVALAKLIAQEFNVDITLEECAELDNLQNVIALLDSKTA